MHVKITHMPRRGNGYLRLVWWCMWTKLPFITNKFWESGARPISQATTVWLLLLCYMFVGPHIKCIPICKIRATLIGGLVLQWCSPEKLTVQLLIEALDNVWYGSWRPLTNLTQTFQVPLLCPFNVAAIFFQGHTYMWCSTIWHNIT